MKNFNIYITGVGGQGIGMLSEVLLRSADHAGWRVKAVDTHGLAQRGGIVVSRLRLGESARSPLIRQGDADLVAALERHEALRGMNGYLKDGGALIYYDTVWQPLEVRLNQAESIGETVITDQCEKRGITEIKVAHPGLKDARMQNIVLLAEIAKRGLIPNVSIRHYEMALADLMEGPMLGQNTTMFRTLSAKNEQGKT